VNAVSTTFTCLTMSIGRDAADSDRLADRDRLAVRGCDHLSTPSAG
jgi:hypothetical protein